MYQGTVVLREFLEDDSPKKGEMGVGKCTFIDLEKNERFGLPWLHLFICLLYYHNCYCTLYETQRAKAALVVVARICVKVPLSSDLLTTLIFLHHWIRLPIEVVDWLIIGGVHHQVGWGFELPDLVKDGLVHGRGIKT